MSSQGSDSRPTFVHKILATDCCLQQKNDNDWMEITEDIYSALVSIFSHLVSTVCVGESVVM